MDTLNFKSATVRTFDLQVTPEMAEQMLMTSPGNRRIRKWHVDVLAGAMQRGQWKITHQGLAFDSTGALRDGHHRLNACKQSGVTVTFRVTVGIDPDSALAMDVGIVRSVSDSTGWDRRIAEPLRLATVIARSTHQPTTEQVYEIANGGLLVALQDLLDHCGSVRRYFTSAPMKLAAAATLMSRPNARTFVFHQYRALCLFDFDQMTPSAKALIRQVENNKAQSASVRDTLVRGLRVFDPDRAEIAKIMVNDGDISAATKFVQTLLLESIGELPAKPSMKRLTERREINQRFAHGISYAQ